MNKKIFLLTSFIFTFLILFSTNNAFAITATGGTITTDGLFTVHKFTSNGTFTITSDLPNISNLIDYCIIAGGGGGGGGGGSYFGGGGGAGGVLCGQIELSVGAYSIVVGSGGLGGTDGAGVGASDDGFNGQNSTAFGLTVIGGGRGGYSCDCGSDRIGANGGSGGGNSASSGAVSTTVGLSLEDQGNNGGIRSGTNGGGGGGVGSKGLPSTSGSGLAFLNSGSSVTLATGGGGGAGESSGSANTGDGGGGGDSNGGGRTGSGGSGIVYIRYLTDATPKLFVNELKATATSTSSITLLWRQSFNHLGIEDSADGWKIERESPVDGGFSTLVSNTGTSTLTYTDNSLLPDTNYNYRVTPYNGTSLGNPSNEANAFTLSNSSDYRNSVLTLYSTPLPNGILLDNNLDGLTDQLFNYLTYGNNVVISQELGNKNNTLGIISLPQGHSIKSVQALKDMILIGSGYNAGSECNSALHIYNITNGVATSSFLTNNYDGVSGTATLEYVTGMIGSDNEPVLHTACDGTITNREYFVTNATDIISNVTSATGGTIKGYNAILSWSDIGSPFTISVDNQNRVRTNFFPSSSSTTTGICASTQGCLTNSSGSPVFIKPVSSPLSYAITVDPNIQLYNGGMELPSGTSIPTKDNLWSSYVPTLSTDPEKVVALLHYKILNSTSLSSEPVRTIFSDATHEYVIYLSGSTVYYIPVTSSLLANRSIGFYIPDNNPDEFDTKLSTSNLPIISYNIETPTGNSTLSNSGIVSTVSGYKYKPSTSLNRIADSDVTNTFSLIPFTIGSLSGNDALIVLVKNAPSVSGVSVRDTSDKYGTTAYNWNIDFLKADDTFTVDLPTNKCVDIFVRDIGNGLDWVDLGNLCNSGTMPKTIVYTQNLSFTFWSLPYGVSHTYDNDIDSLVTQVRHNTLPFNYTVKIFDSNGVEQFNQEFMETTTQVDVQTINASGITKPSLLRVYDVNGDQLYYTTLGLPSYLSGTVAWFDEWLTIDGFNLLFMLPLVFGAMFTRNTVGIGTMSTVALIATLTWFGLVPLPDIALYLMIFIAVVGVIAYKKIYD